MWKFTFVCYLLAFVMGTASGLLKGGTFGEALGRGIVVAAIFGTVGILTAVAVGRANRKIGGGNEAGV